MIYLNNAATSFPKPKQVITAVLSYLDSIPFDFARVGFEISGQDVINACRQKLQISCKSKHLSKDCDSEPA